MEIEFDLKYLKAVALSAGVKDVRYYLNGVCVFAEPRGVFAAATNGHRLAIARVGEFDGETFSTIIPSDVVSAIKPPKTITRITLDTKANTLSTGGVTHSFKPVEGQFPDLWRIIPERITTEVAANYQPRYLLDAHKAIQLCSHRGALEWDGIYQNGDSSGVIHSVACPELVQVVMPIRCARGAPDTFTLPF